MGKTITLSYSVASRKEWYNACLSTYCTVYTISNICRLGSKPERGEPDVLSRGLYWGLPDCLRQFPPPGLYNEYTCGALCCELRARDFGQFNYKFAAGEKFKNLLIGEIFGSGAWTQIRPVCLGPFKRIKALKAYAAYGVTSSIFQSIQDTAGSEMSIRQEKQNFERGNIVK